MPITHETTEHVLNLLTTDVEVKVDVRGFNAVTVQAVEMEAAGGSPVLTVRRSNSGVDEAALESATTLSAPGMTNKIDCSGFGFLHVVVTTAATTTGIWKLVICRKAVV